MKIITNCAGHNQKDKLFYTLEYLLFQANGGSGAIGENNATTQDEIVNYVNTQLSSNLSIPEWQQSVLQGLKDDKIVATKIYPGGGGTFIPCDRNDIKKPIQDLISRIKRELEHLEDYLDLI